MMENPENRRLITDINDKHRHDELRHIEVSEYPIKNRSKAAKFFESVFHALADIARAIDDSYGIVSAVVASIGIFIIMLPMLIIGSILTIGYFIYSKNKRDNNSPYINQFKLNENCEKIISQNHLNLWQRKLDCVSKPLAFVDKEQKPIGMNEFVHLYKPDEIFVLCKKHLQDITDLEKEFASYLSKNVDQDTQQLQAYQQRIAIIKKLLVQRQANAVSKIKNATLKLQMNKQFESHEKQTTPNKNILYYLKRLGVWARDNYKKLLTGATIAATFASLLVLMTGPALLSMFPLNLIIAGGLVILVAAGNYCYKHFFKHRLKKMTASVDTVKHSVHDKRPIMNLLVDSLQIKEQMQAAINTYKNQHQKSKPQADRVNMQFAKPLSSQDYEQFEQEKHIEHIEVKELKAKPHKVRFIMNYVMPALMALNAGYSIGATMLQLSLMSGFIVPIMPFIIMGLCFGGIYVFHRLYRSYVENRSDMKSINALNSSVISSSKMLLWNNKLRLLNTHGLLYSQSIVSAQAFVKHHNAESIVELTKEVFNTLKALDTRNNNQINTHTIVKNLTNVFNAQRATLKSIDRQQLIINELDLDHIQRDSDHDVQLKQKKKAKQVGRQAYNIFAQYFKPLAQGMAFGLSASASLIIFLVGASTLVSIPLAVGLLAVGGVVGVTISIINKIISNKRIHFFRDKKSTKNALKDKEIIMDMYLEAKQALFDARVLTTGKNPIEQHTHKPQLQVRKTTIDDFDAAPNYSDTQRATMAPALSSNTIAVPLVDTEPQVGSVILRKGM